MDEKREDVFDCIDAERERQIAMYGERPQLDLREWVVILAEEVGELARAVQGYIDGDDFESARLHLYDEAVQTAAVAVAIAERMKP